MRLPGFALVDRLAGYMQDFPEGRVRTAGKDLAELTEDVERLVDWVPVSFVSERTRRARDRSSIVLGRRLAQEEAAQGDARPIRSL